MEPATIGPWLGILTAIGTVAGWVIRIHNSLKNEIDALKLTDARQEVKIGICWQAFMDNAKLATVKKDLGTLNTPLKINDKARELFRQAGFDKKLKDYYRSTGKTKSQTELEMDIMAVFRPLFIHTICIPNNFSEGECVAIAVEIAKEAELEQQEGDEPCTHS